MLLLIVAGFFALALAAACNQAAMPVQTTGNLPDVVPTVVAALVVDPATPTAEPLEAVVVTVAEEVNECLVCHTDKQQLIDTAKEEEKVEKESTGVG
jgi:hypothetical protein